MKGEENGKWEIIKCVFMKERGFLTILDKP